MCPAFEPRFPAKYRNKALERFVLKQAAISGTERAKMKTNSSVRVGKGFRCAERERVVDAHGLGLRFASGSRSQPERG